MLEQKTTGTVSVFESVQQKETQNQKCIICDTLQSFLFYRNFPDCLQVPSYKCGRFANLYNQILNSIKTKLQIMDPVTVSAVIAGGTYIYKGITTTFGGQDNQVKHSGKKFAHIVCSKKECTAKHTSCCNKCDSVSVNNCGKFAVLGLGVFGGFPGMGKNCSTCGCPNTDHCYAYANQGFPMYS